MAREAIPTYPGPAVRVLGVLAAGFLIVDGAIGVARNDLAAGLVRSGPIVHLHGFLAWICYGGLLMMSLGIVRLCFPAPGTEHLDFFERRARYGLPAVLGIMIYVGAQLFA